MDEGDLSTPSSKRRRQRYSGVMGTPLHSPGDMLCYDLHIPPHQSSPVPMQGGGGVSGLYSLHDESAHHQHHQTSPLVVTLQQQHHQPHHQLLQQQQHMSALQPHLAQPQHLLMDGSAAGVHEPARQHGLVGRQVQVQVQVQVQTMEADGGTLVFPQTFPGYPPLLLTGGSALRSPEHVDTPLRKANAEAKQL
jgi:hypothetical protein